MHFQPSARLVVVVLVASLPTTQLGAQARVSRPVPGELVDIGGRMMHLQCAGPRDASPTIILLPGAGAFSSTWSRVQGLLVNEKTCAYDPAGIGWSDAASVPRTLRQEAFDLNRLLQRANLQPPFILVGHSMGGGRRPSLRCRVFGRSGHCPRGRAARRQHSIQHGCEPVGPGSRVINWQDRSGTCHWHSESDKPAGRLPGR